MYHVLNYFFYQWLAEVWHLSPPILSTNTGVDFNVLKRDHPWVTNDEVSSTRSGAKYMAIYKKKWNKNKQTKTKETKKQTNKLNKIKNNKQFKHPLQLISNSQVNNLFYFQLFSDTIMVCFIQVFLVLGCITLIQALLLKPCSDGCFIRIQPLSNVLHCDCSGKTGN